MCCRVGKCCCCINLRPGVITVASILLVLDALFLAWTAYGTYYLDRVVQSLLEGGFWDLDPEDRYVQDYVLLGVFWMSVFFNILYSLAIPLDIMLLVGAITVRRRLLHGWLVSYGVLFLINMVIHVVNIVMGCVHDPYRGAVITSIVLIHTGLTVYFWIVVRSYYLELGQQYGEAGPRSTAGKVYRTVPSGDVLPPHGTYGDAGAMAMGPTAPPRYISSA